MTQSAAHHSRGPWLPEDGTPCGRADGEQRRAEDRERLQAAARALLDSDGWARWVRVRATNGLARYSMRNVLLLALQTEGNASYVAGFKRWLALGYCVRRGEQALRIFAKRAVSHRMRSRPTAESVLRGGVCAGEPVSGWGNSSAVCVNRVSRSLRLRITCANVASDAKLDRDSGRCR